MIITEGKDFPRDYMPRTRQNGATRQYRYGGGQWRDMVQVADDRWVIPRDDHPVVSAWVDLSQTVDLSTDEGRQKLLAWAVLAAPYDDHQIISDILGRMREIVGEMHKMRESREIELRLARLTRRLDEIEAVAYGDVMRSAVTPPVVEIPQ